MNEYLTHEIWKMRKTIVSNPNTPTVSLQKVRDGIYQLLLSTCGCDNACTFCNYGFDYKLTLEMVKPELQKINLSESDIFELELEANGSFLSEREVPYDLFLEMLHFVAHKNIPYIVIETHYRTVTEAKIRKIREILGKEQGISFEFGFESAAEDVRAIYNKDIDIDEYLATVKLCEKYGIELQINVLLGAPFLTREEQIQDCLNSLNFIFSSMPKDTMAVLFPINIKKNTMIKHWQDIGVYDQISSWEFVELLYRIPEEYLDKIAIAWWGNRKNTHSPESIMQYPRTCEKCKARLTEFYTNFQETLDPVKRRKMLEQIWDTRCECDIK